MKALLVYPEHTPQTYWSFSGALPYIRRKASLPPLGLVTVAAMLPGVPVHPAGVEGETVTPTGAALVTTLAQSFGPMPAMTVTGVGIGGGTLERAGLPNVLRAFLGEGDARVVADGVFRTPPGQVSDPAPAGQPFSARTR